jgi:hypothetical protein
MGGSAPQGNGGFSTSCRGSWEITAGAAGDDPPLPGPELAMLASGEQDTRLGAESGRADRTQESRALKVFLGDLQTLSTDIENCTTSDTEK